jgi:hypothetical protein
MRILRIEVGKEKIHRKRSNRHAAKDNSRNTHLLKALEIRVSRAAAKRL